MAASLDELFHESNFHAVSSLSSIYGATKITEPTGQNKLLIAMLKGKIASYEYKKSGDSLTKSDKEVTFTYIPADANVVSIDSFYCEARGMIIAIAFFKEANGKLTSFLNIYCNYTYDGTKNKAVHELEAVAENCRTFELHFIPFQLAHCKTKAKYEQAIKRTVFILLGGDCRVHIYSQDQDRGEFSEQELQDYFPEFSELGAVPMYVDIKITSDEERRISVIGHQSGDILLFVTDLTKEDWPLVSWVIQHDSPITRVLLFTKYTNQPPPEFLEEKVSVANPSQAQRDNYHLLVTSSWENAVVYCHCAEVGFDAPLVLGKSSTLDCVTCCAVADIDHDGVNDIIIGTYGQEILVYKFDDTKLEDAGVPVFLSPYWSRSFAYPVINIVFLDLTNDGLQEMSVITTQGLHLFQRNLQSALNECKRKLKLLKNIKDREEDRSGLS